MRSFATVLAVVALLAAGTANAGAVTAVQRDANGAYVRSDPALALCGVTLFVRAGLDREEANQNGLAALVAESIVRVPVNGVPLTDAITARGGSLSYAVAPRYVRFYLEGPADDIAALATMVAHALAMKSFDPATVAAARATLAGRIAEDEQDPRQVGTEMLRESHYVGSTGLPPLGTATGLASLTSADMQTFFAQFYRGGNAFVTVVGRTGPASEAATRELVAALPTGVASENPIAVRPYGAQPKRLVTRRDVYAPYVVIGFAAPSLGDPDFAASLVMRTLLGEVLDRPSATTTPLPLRASGISYGYDTAPAQMTLWLNGSLIDPTAGLTAIDAVLKRAAAQPLTDAVVARFKARARGEWALENLSLEERGWELGNAVALGLDADVDAGVDAAIQKVTASDVQRVAKQYFQRFDVALVLPRAASGG